MRTRELRRCIQSPQMTGSTMIERKEMMKQKMTRAVVNLTVRVTVDVPTHIYKRDIAAAKSDCKVLGDEFKESDLWSDWAGEAVNRRINFTCGPNGDTDVTECVAEIDGCEILDDPEDV
jgi:hypothetical protein